MRSTHASSISRNRTTTAAASSLRTAAASSSVAAAAVTSSSALAQPSTKAASGPVSRAARLAALRVQRDQLTAEIASQTSTVAALQAEVDDLRLSLSSENDALTGVMDAHYLDSSRSALVQAFLVERQSTNMVWREYLQRIRRQALLDAPGPNEAAGDNTKFFAADAQNGETLTTSQRALRSALHSVQDAFQRTFDASVADSNADVAPSSQPAQSPPYLKLTVDAISSRPDLRQLYGVDDESASTRIHPATFFAHLNAEVERGTREIQQRIQELERERAQTHGAAPTLASASIQDTLSSLISSLQSESTTRFVQAHKLANETDSLSAILEELQQKQREGDADILNAPSNEVPFETKHTLQSVRRLQNLQLSLAALKSQVAFASKTYATFAHIRDSRQSAMDAFLDQKRVIDAFHSDRKSNERRMVEMVLQNKELRKKTSDYHARVINLVATELQPMCNKIEETAKQLVDSVAEEAKQGVACIVSPLSTIEAIRESGGPGRVPVARLALHQIQRTSVQSNQLHALVMDPFGTNGAVSAQPTFKGLLGFQLYKNPTQIILQMQQLVQKGAHATISTANETCARIHSHNMLALLTHEPCCLLLCQACTSPSCRASPRRPIMN